MKLIIGLGNPEPDHRWQRHNVGKEIVNMFVRDKGIGGEWKKNGKCDAEVAIMRLRTYEVRIGKPMGYMNDIGRSVAKLVRFYKVKTRDLLIVYDELDFVLGEYKISQSITARHNGAKSVEMWLKSNKFWHMRVGVRDARIAGSVQKTGREPGKYVLEKMGFFARRKIRNLYSESIKSELTNWLSKKD